MTDDDTQFFPVLTEHDPPRPTRRIVHTVRHVTSSPKSSLYEVEQGLDRYYVVAADDEAVFDVAAKRLLEHPDRCSWPPVISEVIR